MQKIDIEPIHCFNMIDIDYSDEWLVVYGKFKEMSRDYYLKSIIICDLMVLYNRVN